MSVTVIKDGGVQSIKDGAGASSQEVTTHTAIVNAHHNCSVKPSDTVLNTNATERTSVSDSYAKLKETRVHVTGHYRVTFEMKCGGDYIVKGKIYCNGVTVGTERSEENTLTYAEQTAEDLHFNAGDLVQIYAHTTIATTQTVYIQNFKLKGTAMTAFEDTSGK